MTSRMLRRDGSLRTVIMLLPILAVTAQAQEGDEVALPSLTISGEIEETATSPVGGYVATRSATATKTDTPLIETPQSVTVLSREQIVDQGATNLQDALNYAAGVRSDAYGLDSRTDSARVRGSNPDEYVDGLRQLFNWYTSTTRVDPYLLERIEVLRGPAAMLYGQGGTGGIVNMVTKRPQAEVQREVGVRVGSHDLKQLQADFTGPLTEDGAWLYRLVALARDAQTQVDYVDDDRLLLAPSLTWLPNERTTLTLQALWQEDHSGSTAQFLPWEGNVVYNPNGWISTDRFVGEPGFDRYDSERESFGWQFEHRFHEKWSFRQNLRYVRNEVHYRTLYADSFTHPGDSYIDPERRLVGRYPQISQPSVRMLTTDQHVEGSFQTGEIEHKLLVGVDALRFRQQDKAFYDAPVYLGGTAPNIDVYAPVYSGYTAGPLTDRPEQRLSHVGSYVQSQMTYADRWIVLLGMRHDRVISELDGSEDEKSNATTHRAALMYAAPNGISPYISYSESFSPVAGINFFGSRFEPLLGNQREIGVKYQPRGGNLNINVAFYDLREENQKAPDPAHPLNTIQAGSTRTQGAELEVKGSFGALDVIAHYNYTDIDEALEALPAHQAAVWSTWRFSLAGVPGFSLGGGLRWFDAFADGVAPTTPEVLLVDGLLAWDSGQWRLALNASNLTDEVYMSTCLSRGDCFVGARRNVIGTVTYRF